MKPKPPKPPKNPPTYGLAKRNKMFADEMTALMRFVSFKEPVACAHCGKKKRHLWTMLVPFKAQTFGPLVLVAGKLLPPLAPVCSDHPLAPDGAVMNEIAVSFRYYRYELAPKEPAKKPA